MDSWPEGSSDSRPDSPLAGSAGAMCSPSSCQTSPSSPSPFTAPSRPAASTTVNSLATVQDAEYQLRNAGARFLVTVAPFLDRAAPAAAQVGIEQLFVVGEARGVTPFGALFDAGGSGPTPPSPRRRELARSPTPHG